MCFGRGGVPPLLGPVLGDSPPRHSVLPPKTTPLLKKRGGGGGLTLPPILHRLSVVNGGIILNKVSYGLYIILSPSYPC